MLTIFPDFWQPFPPCRQFFSTIRWQFWQIVDPSQLPTFFWLPPNNYICQKAYLLISVPYFVAPVLWLYISVLFILPNSNSNFYQEASSQHFFKRSLTGIKIWGSYLQHKIKTSVKLFFYNLPIDFSALLCCTSFMIISFLFFLPNSNTIRPKVIVYKSCRVVFSKTFHVYEKNTQLQHHFCHFY